MFSKVPLIAMNYFSNTPPFMIALKDFVGDNSIRCEQLLRSLPRKRLVYKGSWQKRSVIIKIFIDPKSSRRHWTREKDGVESLKSANIPTPELLFSGRLTDNTLVLVFDFLPDAQTALVVWNKFSTLESKSNFLNQLVSLLGVMHDKGLVQEDLHLENFLCSGKQLYAIDGDTISTENNDAPLDLKSSSRNLALLFAQLPPSFDSLMVESTRHYAEQRDLSAEQLLARLTLDLPKIRRWRRHKYVKKSYRTCSEFIRTKRAGQVTISRRDTQGETLDHFLSDPDAFMQQGEILKSGNTSTVVRVQVDGYDWVVKRYNIKSPWHFLTRCFRPTRAWKSWGNAHRLKISGIATPKAVAMVEKRIGPLRSKGYYVCEFIAGLPGEDFFQTDTVATSVKEQAAERFVLLFELFRKLNICHGDCKSTNFLLKDNEPWVLDLDAMHECLSRTAFERRFQVDRHRFLLNWQSQPELRRWFDEHLPK